MVTVIITLHQTSCNAFSSRSCFAYVNIVYLSHKSPVLVLSPRWCLEIPGVSMISASLHQDTIRQHAALLIFKTPYVLQIFLSVMCLLSLCIFHNILIFSFFPARFMYLAAQRNSLKRSVRSQTPADVGSDEIFFPPFLDFWLCLWQWTVKRDFFPIHKILYMPFIPLSWAASRSTN